MTTVFLQLVDQLSASLALQIFAASTSILIISLVALVWARAVRWSFLDTVPLNKVEFHHPHLPSVRNILFQAAAFVCVTAAVLITEKAMWEESFRIAQHLGPVLLITTVGIASELHSIRARIYGLSLSLGTAIGMGVASLANITSITGALTSMLLSGATALLLAAQIQNKSLVKRWPLNAHLLLVLTAGIWYFFLHS